jgi:uncharacterized protein (DUF885 family)
MKKLLMLVYSTLFILSGCQPTETEKKPLSADGAFQQISEDFISGWLAWRPVAAINLGFHEYDGRLTNFSKQSIDSELTRLKDYVQKLDGIDSSALTEKMYYDYRILKNAIKAEIFNFEDLQIYIKNPMTYAGIIDANTYIKRNFAPIEKRLSAIIAMENLAPQEFEYAKANLQDSLAKPFVDMAILVASGSVSFLSNDLVTALKEVKNDTLMAAFTASNKKAIDAIRGYISWLQKEKLPKAHNHYAIGRENYQKMLLYNEGISMSPDQILAIGLRELKKEQESFNAAAQIINPNKKPEDVYNDLKKNILWPRI